MNLQIFSDDLHEGKWFKNLTSLLNSASIITLKKRGENPPHIEKLLRYDRPDIILIEDDNPVLVLEKTREVPTGHNVGQRFGRLVNSAEEEVLTIFYLPFVAKKHGAYASICYVPARLFLSLQKMEEIHKIPILAVNWPSDEYGELIHDGTEQKELSELVEQLLKNNFNYSKCDVITKIQKKMNSQIETLDPRTITPPTSVSFENTAEYKKYLSENFSDFSDIPSNFWKRERTLIYKNKMTEENCRREDPYTGQQFIYDYMECRSGKKVTDKHTNLVLKCPLISKKRWLEANPNKNTRKSALWYATADLIELKDGLLFPESKIGKIGKC
jgi:hypothetical protein